ncbi:MAG TPA: hypothetical protein VGR98_09750 [Streptosporangiaceae bacterium]|nr:hypothetical protein [Streptosporangiaceae bacterium]
MSFALHLPAALSSAGVWNIIAVRSQIHRRYETTLAVKLLLVATSGISAALHARAHTAAGLAAFGTLAGVSALAAVFPGIQPAG